MLTQTSKIDQTGRVLLSQPMLEALGLSAETEVEIVLTESEIVIKPKLPEVEIPGKPAEQPAPPPLDDDREKARQALREAGLLTELHPDLIRLANLNVSLEDVQASLARAGGKPLSEIILEQRGPNDHP